MMTPKQIIEHRARLYTEKNGGGVYDLYSENSDLKRFFTDIESFCVRFSEITGESSHAGLNIVKELVKGKLAEVTFIEYFSKEDKILSFFSRSRLILEEGRWRILREEREMSIK
ncbi:hypothetical protein EP073_03720 [Geovibrio thiophilus]|uniref:Nuclear transport factor 2 family protein n=1 Tax=Geovibrio thiophilus TaxID=139438 RepID=A0A3R5UY07_9BACT|nr:hypothetical protein [Geovibrio thiophilus]QAR32542.1 hypothetical protein EP073_03720 [Geovibrio thiophilus]